MSQYMVLSSAIRQGATKKRKQRIRQAQFGDGYSQEVADGINSIMDEWQGVGWDYLEAADVVIAEAMLEALGGTDYVIWTPPGETQKKFKVTDGWTKTYIPGGLTSITFNLKQIA